MLPFCEQTPMFDKWLSGRNDGHVRSNGGVMRTIRRSMGNKFLLPYASCPSNPLAREVSQSGVTFTATDYVAMAGAVRERDFVPRPASPWLYSNPGRRGGYRSNRISRNGMFTAQISIRFADDTDGTSNTMLFGEIANYLYSANRQTKADRRPSAVYGWAMGDVNNHDYTHYSANVNCLRYPPNADVLNRPGARNSWADRLNVPLLSAHPGSVVIALADGSVRSLNDTIDAKTYIYLGVRNDGQPLGDF